MIAIVAVQNDFLTLLDIRTPCSDLSKVKVKLSKDKRTLFDRQSFFQIKVGLKILTMSVKNIGINHCSLNKVFKYLTR